MVAISCRAWPSSQSWVCLSSALVASRPQFQERERDEDQQEVDDDEQDDGEDLGRGGGRPGDQEVQRGEIAGARDADHRAGQHGQPEPGLAERPPRPAVLLLRRARLLAPGRDRCLAAAVQRGRWRAARRR